MRHAQPVCSKCGDTGKIGRELPEERRELGGDLVSVIGGYTTDLCECRRKLPKRFGKATWWHREYLPGEEINLLDRGTVTVRFDRELPLTEDGHPLHRTADNCYFSVSPLIEMDLPVAMIADDLRQIAALFLRMAERCDELDKPVEPPAP